MTTHTLSSVVSVTKLKKAAYNVAYQLGYNPQAQEKKSGPTTEAEALGNFWYYSADRFSSKLESMLIILNIDRHKQDLMHKELTLYLWRTYQKRLTSALKHPVHCASAWSALEKLHILQPNFANQILNNASKAKMFSQVNFRKNINVIAALEANLTSTTTNSAPLLNTSLKDNPKFAKRTLMWAWDFKLTTGQDTKNISAASAQPNLLRNIENGYVSEKGVDEYLKWARSPLRLWDRIVFSLAGSKYFDKNHRPYPPSKSFINQVAIALDNRRKKKLDQAVAQCAEPKQAIHQNELDQQPPAGNVAAPPQQPLLQNIPTGMVTPSKTIDNNKLFDTPLTQHSTTGSSTPSLSTPIPSSPLSNSESFATPPLSPLTPTSSASSKSSSSSSSSGTPYMLRVLTINNNENDRLIVSVCLSDGKVMMEQEITKQTYLGTYDFDTQRLEITNQETGVINIGVVSLENDKYTFLVEETITPINTSRVEELPETPVMSPISAPIMAKLNLTPSLDLDSSSSPIQSTPNLNMEHPSPAAGANQSLLDTPELLGTPLIETSVNKQDSDSKNVNRSNNYAKINKLMNNSPGSPKRDKTKTLKLRSLEEEFEAAKENKPLVVNAEPTQQTDTTHHQTMRRI